MVISLLIALVAWVYVVYTVNPTKDVKYYGVPITFEGEDKLAYAGMAVETASAESADIVLSIKRTEMTDISAENIAVIADVSTATRGNNTIDLEIVPPEGTALVKKSIGTVTVEVGDDGIARTANLLDSRSDDRVAILLVSDSTLNIYVLCHCRKRATEHHEHGEKNLLDLFHN